jgi:co-chaperonin GroES (HSP10)
MKIRPLHDHILVEREEEKAVKKGSIIIIPPRRSPRRAR